METHQLPTGIELRPFEDSDRPFCFALFCEITAPGFAGIGLSEEHLGALLEQQCEIRNTQWRQNYPETAWSIIIDDAGEPVGEFSVAETVDSMVLVNIALLGKARGRGIAAGLVRNLFSAADRLSKPVTAHVLKSNPAREIWLHLGFEVVENAGPYDRIERQPAS